MTQLVTHFCKFTDEATAQTQLAAYGSFDASNNWSWRGDIVDAPVPIKNPNGSLTAGYFLNIALPALDTSLPGLTGAGYGPAENFTLLYGTAPLTPQRIFAY